MPEGGQCDGADTASMNKGTTKIEGATGEDASERKEDKGHSEGSDQQHSAVKEHHSDTASGHSANNPKSTFKASSGESNDVESNRNTVGSGKKEDKAEKARKTRPIPEYDEASLPKLQIYPKREHYAVDNKRLCAFGGSVCKQRPMRGYEFCIKHILQDQSAPWKQCDHMVKGKRCSNPVNVRDNDDTRFCNPHKQMFGILPKGSSNYGKAARAERRKQQKQKQKLEQNTQATKSSSSSSSASSAAATTDASERAKSTHKSSSASSPLDSKPSSSNNEGSVVSKRENDPGSAVYPTNRPSQRRKNSDATQQSISKIDNPVFDSETDSDSDFVGQNEAVAKLDGKEQQQQQQKKKKKKRGRAEKQKSAKSGGGKRRRLAHCSNGARLLETLDGSETDSDLSESDDENYMYEAFDRDPLQYTHHLRSVEQVTEEEALHLRRERIMSLLHIYQKQYRHLKHELASKYNEFLRQRNAAASHLLATVGKYCSAKTVVDPIEVVADDIDESKLRNLAAQDSEHSVSIEMRVTGEHDGAAERTRWQQLQQQIDRIRDCGPIQRPNRIVPQFTRVEKYHSDGRPLCVYSNCTHYRMLLSEFCFQHILFDSSQRLYTAAADGDFFRPVLLHADTILNLPPAQVRELDRSGVSNSRKMVSIEGRRRSSSSSTTTPSQPDRNVKKVSSKKARALKLADQIRDTVARVTIGQGQQEEQQQVEQQQQLQVKRD